MKTVIAGTARKNNELLSNYTQHIPRVI